MKKTEQYLKQLFEEPFQLEEGTIDWDFLQVIKQAQIDAIEETCRVCAEEAKIKEKIKSTFYNKSNWKTIIDKKSILKVADKLKKEII